MSDPNTRVQRGVDDFIGGIDRAHLRPMQREGHLCAARCYENGSSTQEQVQQCAQQCSLKTTRAEQVLNQELKGFQERLQRCAMSCRDSVQDRVPTDGSNLQPAQIAALQSEVETCANKCVDTHLGLLPNMKSRVASSIKSMQ